VEFKAAVTDGCNIKWTDSNLDPHVGGRVEEEYKYVFDRPLAPAATSRVTPNTLFFRELFISVDGTIYHDWGFKINGDFSQQAAPAGSGAIAELAFFEWKRWNEFRIMVGQFKEPASMETLCSALFQDTIQRSPMSRFIESLDIGVQVYGSLWDSLLTY